MYEVRRLLGTGHLISDRLNVLDDIDCTPLLEYKYSSICILQVLLLVCLCISTHNLQVLYSMVHGTVPMSNVHVEQAVGCSNKYSEYCVLTPRFQTIDRS